MAKTQKCYNSTESSVIYIYTEFGNEFQPKKKIISVLWSGFHIKLLDNN